MANCNETFWEETKVRTKAMLWCLPALLAVGPPAHGQGVKLDGTWKLSTQSTAADTPEALIQIATVGGEPRGALIDSRLKGAAVKTLTRKGDTVRLVLVVNGQELTFEGTPGKGGKVI